MTARQLRITAAGAFLALCGIVGLALAAPRHSLPASCFVSGQERVCIEQWEKGL